jgi:hypothetical protein
MLRLLLREYPTLTYNDLVEMADLVGFDLTEARPSNAGGSLPELSGLSTVRRYGRGPPASHLAPDLGIASGEI